MSFETPFSLLMFKRLPKFLTVGWLSLSFFFLVFLPFVFFLRILELIEQEAKRLVWGDCCRRTIIRRRDGVVEDFHIYLTGKKKHNNT